MLYSNNGLHAKVRAKLSWTVTLTKNKVVVAIAGGVPVTSGERVSYYQTGDVLEFDLSPGPVAPPTRRP